MCKKYPVGLNYDRSWIKKRILVFAMFSCTRHDVIKHPRNRKILS